MDALSMDNTLSNVESTVRHASQLISCVGQGVSTQGMVLGAQSLRDPKLLRRTSQRAGFSELAYVTGDSDETFYKGCLVARSRQRMAFTICGLV